MRTAPGGALYDATTDAWNVHARHTVNWQALSALVAGALLGYIFILVVVPLWRATSYCCSRAACRLQCCLVVHMAPERLPMIRTTNRPGVRKTSVRAPQQVRATPAQWNAMRIKLGPQLPDESIADMVSNFGDDVEEAFRRYYAPLR